MKKLLLLSAIVISVYGHAQSLVAVPDTFTVLQATVDTFDVTHNDSIPASDSVCITLLDTGSRFLVLNCRSIVYHPDSTFTGRDTCRYVLCDTAHLCDTAVVVVYVDTNYALLLPVARFKDDSLNGTFEDILFVCNTSGGDWVYDRYQLSSTSQNADSLSWQIRGSSSVQNNIIFDSIAFLHGDTIDFTPLALWPNWFQLHHVEICLTAYNSFGNITHCDTSCYLVIQGIAEIPLSNIHIYPNPADRILTIDMRQNNNSICADYAAIDIYDALGQKLRSIPLHDSSRLVEVNVTDMPEGIYVSTIVDAQGKEMVLGRFTVGR